MARYITQAVYAPGGVNLKLPDTIRNVKEAVDGLNFDMFAAGHLGKRKGFAIKHENDVGFGLSVYKKFTPTSIDIDGWGTLLWGTEPWGSPATLGGTETDTLIGLSASPKEWTNGTFEITYSGTGVASVTISATTDSDIKLVLTVDGSSVLTTSLGDGTEASPITVSDLATTVSAVTDFSASVASGSTTAVAVSLDFQNAEAITGSPLDIGFGDWSDITAPLDTLLSQLETRKLESDFENPSTVSTDGVLYITDGYDDMLKYDSQNLYRAGMPGGQIPSIALDTGTASPGMSGSYKYILTYIQIDKVGNVIEGAHSTISDTLDNSAGPYAIDVTMTNIDAASGFNTNGAMAVGAQTSSSLGGGLERLTVDDGAGGAHTFQVGDEAYFYDIVTDTYVTKEVSAISSTTVTVESDTALQVADNAIMSNNLRLALYRTKAGGTLYYLVEELPNNSFTSSQVHNDTKADNDLNILMTTPFKTPEVPPKSKYMTTWRNQLIMSGDPASPSSIYYSEFADVGSPENFPGINVFEISKQSGGGVSGLGVLGTNLFIFTEDQIHVVEGNLALDQIRVDLLSENVGCVAHHTIHSIDNTLFFLSKKGVYRIEPGGSGYKVVPTSPQIDPVFRIDSNKAHRKYWKRATASVWADEKKYLLFLPEEAQTGEYKYATSNSRVYVYDMDAGQWYIWSNMDCAGGLVTFDDGITEAVPWFNGRGSTGTNTLYRFNSTRSEIDYADHVSPVDFNYRPQWDFGNSPSIRKVYNNLALDSFRSGSQLNFTPSGDVTVTTFRDFNHTTEESTFTASFFDDDRQVVLPLPRSTRRAIGLKLANDTLNEQVLISGWTLESYSYTSEVRQ